MYLPPAGKHQCPQLRTCHMQTRGPPCVPTPSQPSPPSELMAPRGSRHTFHTRVPGISWCASAQMAMTQRDGALEMCRGMMVHGMTTETRVRVGPRPAHTASGTARGQGEAGAPAPPRNPSPTFADGHQHAAGRRAPPHPLQKRRGRPLPPALLKGRAGPGAGGGGRAQGAGPGRKGRGRDVVGGAGLERARRAVGATLVGPRETWPTDFAGGRSPQFLGRWFTLALASNSSWFQEKKASLSMCTTLVATTPDGGLNLTNTFLRWDDGVGFWGQQPPPAVVMG